MPPVMSSVSMWPKATYPNPAQHESTDDAVITCTPRTAGNDMDIVEAARSMTSNTYTCMYVHVS
jgi:hypothetical protein